MGYEFEKRKNKKDKKKKNNDGIYSQKHIRLKINTIQTPKKTEQLKNKK